MDAFSQILKMHITLITIINMYTLLFQYSSGTSKLFNQIKTVNKIIIYNLP